MEVFAEKFGIRSVLFDIQGSNSPHSGPLPEGEGEWRATRVLRNRAQRATFFGTLEVAKVLRARLFRATRALRAASLTKVEKETARREPGAQLNALTPALSHGERE